FLQPPDTPYRVQRRLFRHLRKIEPQSFQSSQVSQRKSREALHPHQNFLRGVLPSSASCRSTHVWISSRSPNPDRSFAACRSALASSRQPRLLKKAFQIVISSSFGRLPRSNHHSRISSSDPPLSVR